MSSTNRGAHRVTNDRYITPASAIDSLLDVLSIPLDTSFIEPCKATGAIFDRVDCAIKRYTEIDEGADYLTNYFNGYDLIITNPPFTLALEFLQKSLREADSVFYLLRLNFLGSAKRKAFWNANRPTHTLVLSQRPCFVWVCQGDKKRKIKSCGAAYHPGTTTVCECGCKVKAQTDSIEYAWFGWDRAGFCKLPSGVHVL